MLQSARVSKPTGYVLQGARVVKYMCCKVHVLQGAHVVNGMCCKVQKNGIIHNASYALDSAFYTLHKFLKHLLKKCLKTVFQKSAIHK